MNNNKPFDFALGGLGWYAYTTTEHSTSPVENEKADIEILILREMMDNCYMNMRMQSDAVRWNSIPIPHSAYSNVVGWRYAEKKET